MWTCVCRDLTYDAFTPGMGSTSCLPTAHLVIIRSILIPRMLFLHTLCRTRNVRRQWNDSQIYICHLTIYRPWQKLNSAKKKKSTFWEISFRWINCKRTENLLGTQQKKNIKKWPELIRNSSNDWMISPERTGELNFTWSLTKRVVYLELCTPRWAGFRWVSARLHWRRCGTSSARSLGAKVSGPLWPGQWSEEAQKCTQWWGLKIFYSCKTQKNRQG